MTELAAKTNLVDSTARESSTYEKAETKPKAATIDSGQKETIEVSPISIDEGKGLEAGASLFEFPEEPQKHEVLSAAEIRKINRAITKRIPIRDEELLVEERNAFIDKKFKDGLTNQEERRLTFVRWQLDRIDDARYGEALDVFEAIAKEQEHFGSQIENLLSQFKKR